MNIQIFAHPYPLTKTKKGEKFAYKSTTTIFVQVALKWVQLTLVTECSGICECETESGGGCPGLPVPNFIYLDAHNHADDHSSTLVTALLVTLTNSPHGLCGGKATLNSNSASAPHLNCDRCLVAIPREACELTPCSSFPWILITGVWWTNLPF